MSTIPARRCLLPRRTKRTNPRLKSVGKTQRHKGHKDTKKAAIKNYLRRPSLCLCALCVFVFLVPESNPDFRARSKLSGLPLREFPVLNESSPRAQAAAHRDRKCP